MIKQDGKMFRVFDASGRDTGKYGMSLTKAQQIEAKLGIKSGGPSPVRAPAPPPRPAPVSVPSNWLAPSTSWTTERKPQKSERSVNYVSDTLNRVAAQRAASRGMSVEDFNAAQEAAEDALADAMAEAKQRAREKITQTVSTSASSQGVLGRGPLYARSVPEGAAGRVERPEWAKKRPKHIAANNPSRRKNSRAVRR